MVKSISKILLLVGLLGSFWFSSIQLAKAANGSCEITKLRCINNGCRGVCDSICNCQVASKLLDQE